MKTYKLSISSSKQSNFLLASILVMIMFIIFVVNINKSFGQSIHEVGLNDNVIAGLYVSEPIENPAGLVVYQNYPNPFSATTTIKFETSSFTNLKLAIYDSNENLIKAMLFDNIQPGSHEVAIDANSFPAGEYSYRFSSGNYSQSYKMTIVK